MLKRRLIFIGFVIGCIYLVYYQNAFIIDFTLLKILGGFALLQLIYIFWSWHKLTGRYIDAYTVFMIACYAFNLSQPIMEIFDCVTPERSLITHYHWPMSIYCLGTVFTMAFILCFHFGAILAAKPEKMKLNRSDPDKFALQLKAIKKIATPLAIISFPFYMYNTIIMMVVSMTMGYGAIYDGDIGTSTLFKLIGDFYVPAMISLFLVSQAIGKRVWLIIIITVLTVVMPPLIIGGRSNAIIILAVLFIVYSFFHKLSLKRVVIVGLSTYLIFVVFTAIAGSRGTANRDLSSMMEVDIDKGNPALFTLSEMGGSLQPLMHCLDILPNKMNYKYGESYLYSIITIIPNMGFWDVHPATKKANLGNWLQDYLGINYGLGFSIVAEAYYNFGYLGCFMMTFLGWCFTKIYHLVSRSELMRNPIAFIIAVIFLFFTIKLVRNSFEFAIRAILYYCLPMYWIMRQTYRKLRKKQKYQHNYNNNISINTPTIQK